MDSLHFDENRIAFRVVSHGLVFPCIGLYEILESVVDLSDLFFIEIFGREEIDECLPYKGQFFFIRASKFLGVAFEGLYMIVE